MRPRAAALACLALCGAAAGTAAITAASTAALAQSRTPGGMPPPAGMSLERSNAMRFPQPVRAGQLLGRTVLRPVESQAVLGRVHDVVRNAAGEVMVVMSLGGVLGIGSRLVAVPVDAMVLLGDVMEVVAYTPAQLNSLPTFTPGSTTQVPHDTLLRVGLAKPSH